jgi:hypothetical protein
MKYLVFLSQDISLRSYNCHDERKLRNVVRTTTISRTRPAFQSKDIIRKRIMYAHATMRELIAIFLRDLKDPVDLCHIADEL